MCLSKYGEAGRAFVMVEATQPWCECYFKLSNGDELVSVNGAYVLEPTASAVKTLLRFVDEAPRPLLATFVLGEDRQTVEPPWLTTL